MWQKHTKKIPETFSTLSHHSASQTYLHITQKAEPCIQDRKKRNKLKMKKNMK